MAIVPRKRARSTVYFVVTKGHWERVGSDRREAERLDARRKREVKAGTYKPGGGTGKQTVRAYAEKWLDGRKVKAAATEAQLVRDYVLSTDFAELRVEDVRPRHVLALIERLRVAVPVSGRSPTLSGKTVANIVGVLKTLFRDAVIGEAAAANPVVVPRGTLSRKGARRQSYELDAARAVLAGTRRPEARVFAAGQLYGGFREGEGCGLRWRAWDPYAKPLGCITLTTQYEDDPLKTDRPRRVPVHPEYAALLWWWHHVGWELTYRRKPTADDFIVPPPRTPDRCYTKSGAYQLWRQLLRETGVTNLSLHSTRHTFLTLARRGGAREEVIEQVTHNARGSMVDQYTHWDWAPLCEAVMCLPSLLQELAASSQGHGTTRRDEPAPRLARQSPGSVVPAAGEATDGGGVAGDRARMPFAPAGEIAPDAVEAPDSTERTETQADGFLAGRLTDNADERLFRLQRLDSNTGAHPNLTALDRIARPNTGQASSENPAGKALERAELAAGQEPDVLAPFGEPRPPGCVCEVEVGDAPCPVHGEDDIEPTSAPADAKPVCLRSLTEAEVQRVRDALDPDFVEKTFEEAGRQRAAVSGARPSMRVLVEPFFPFKATDKKTGKQFDCHCVRMRTTDGEEMLVVSRQFFDRMKAALPGPDEGENDG